MNGFTIWKISNFSWPVVRNKLSSVHKLSTRFFRGCSRMCFCQSLLRLAPYPCWAWNSEIRVLLWWYTLFYCPFFPAPKFYFQQLPVRGVLRQVSFSPYMPKTWDFKLAALAKQNFESVLHQFITGFGDHLNRPITSSPQHSSRTFEEHPM